MIECEITTLTPLIIGSREINSSIDYYIDETDSTVNLFDFNKLLSDMTSNQTFLKELERYLSTEDSRRIRVKEFLNSRGIDYKKYIKEKLSIANPDDFRSTTGFRKGPITRFVHYDDGKYYIPGSSVKGAIRTALIYSYYKANKDVFLNVLDRNFGGNTQSPNRDNFKISNVEESLIETFELSIKKEKSIKNEDLAVFSKIQISDSTPISKTNVKIFALKRKNILAGANRSEIPVYYEGINMNTQTYFKLKLDDNFFSIDEIRGAIATFSKDILADELESNFLPELHKELEKLISNGSLLISLGFGGSMKTKSLFLLVKELYKNNRNQIVERFADNLLGEVIRASRRGREYTKRKTFQDILSEPFPVTRYIINLKSGITVPGWIKLTF